MSRFHNPLLAGYVVKCGKCGTVHGSLLACPQPAPAVPAPREEREDEPAESPAALIEQLLNANAALERAEVGSEAEEHWRARYAAKRAQIIARMTLAAAPVAPARDKAFTQEELDAIDEMVSDWAPSAKDERLRPDWVKAQFALQARILNALRTPLRITLDGWRCDTCGELVTDFRAHLANDGTCGTPRPSGEAVTRASGEVE